MSTNLIMVTASELNDALDSVGLVPSSQDTFVNIFQYIEDVTGEWFALDNNKAQSFHIAHDPLLLDLDEIYSGWFAFWMCVFNNTEGGSELETQALGAIRGLFFMAAHNRQITVPSAIETWWLETNEVHQNNSLNEVSV
ncbi:hypothetical protein L4D09_28050 [Photobacterium makurazakiensis]|uniref:hypothetical protein n=1 Tax=Photobacterium makurazakiensis TaxID=2910234 RepID=UPI003D0F2346